MKKHTLFLLYIIISLHSLLECSKEKGKEVSGKIKETVGQSNQQPTHTMLMFLDESEVGLGDTEAVSRSFLVAIAQKACPILVSRHLLINALARPTLSQLAARDYKNDKEKESYIDAKKIYDENLQQLKKADMSEDEKETIRFSLANLEITGSPINNATSEGFLLETVDFKPDEWLMFATPGYSMYLLIPRSYATNVASLGLKTASLLAPQKELREALVNGHMIENQALDTNVYFLPTLEALFITRQEQQKMNQASPQWVIYALGHGEIDKGIISLSLKNFPTFLDFLDKKLNTKLLAYVSCYASGKNLQTVYGNLKEGAIKTYSYPIATQGIADIAMSKYHVKVTHATKAELRHLEINPKTGKLSLKTNAHFDSFVHDVEHDEIINFKDTLKNILYYTENLNEIPLLRLPGLEWFNVVDVDDAVVSIGTVLAKTQDQPFSLKSYYERRVKKGGELKGVLLYTPVIPFELIVDTNKMPRFISMMPGNALHEFDKISVSTKIESFDNIRKAFSLTFKSNIQLSTRKTFYISELYLPIVEWGYGRNKIDYGSPLRSVIFDLNTTDETYYFETNDGRRYYNGSETDIDYILDPKYAKVLGISSPQRVEIFRARGNLIPSKKTQKSKALEHKKRSDIASYQSLEMLHNDPAFTKWRTKYSKTAPKELEPLIKQEQDTLLAKKKKAVDATDQSELRMMQKMSEFMKLEKWYGTLSDDEKKKIKVAAEKEKVGK